MSVSIATPILTEAGAEAIEPVMSVMAQAFDRSFGEAWNQEQCLGILGLPGVWLMLASLDNDVTGFTLARVIADEAELLLIAVKPALHRKGIGALLLDTVINGAAKRGATRLHLEVRDGNPALELYQRLGFTAVGRRHGYYRGHFGQSFDALTLSRSLNSTSPRDIDHL